MTHEVLVPEAFVMKLIELLYHQQDRHSETILLYRDLIDSMRSDIKRLSCQIDTLTKTNAT